MLSLAVTYSRALIGVQAPSVMVETHLSFGLPKFTIVGLPEKAVKESKDRVRSALLNSKFEFPSYRITVNLAPADLPKETGRYDLPIALSILAASKQINAEQLNGYEFIGELALSGELRTVTGILPIAIATKKAKKILVIPAENAEEAALVDGLTVYPVTHLNEIVAHLNQQSILAEYHSASQIKVNLLQPDFAEVIGQYQAKRALEIAAAGGHSLLMVGPPGTGKTMLASRLPSILPKMTNQEALESAAVLSISHLGFDKTKWQQRSFRTPHHSASAVALVGGGNPPAPGEISLAHHGILFLDELPEFSRSVLESLREPLESGSITISRAARQSKFPAAFQLIAAMNPCPCGYLGDSYQACRCTPEQIQRYKNKLSGPLLDRIDLFIHVPRIAITQLMSRTVNRNETSEQVRQRVNQARQKQFARGEVINARLDKKGLDLCCNLDNKEEKLLQAVINQLKLSARSYHRTLKVARTIADLEASEKITEDHLKEALNYRCMVK